MCGVSVCVGCVRAYLGTETKAIAIGESGASIVKHARAVHLCEQMPKMSVNLRPILNYARTNKQIHHKARTHMPNEDGIDMPSAVLVHVHLHSHSHSNTSNNTTTKTSKHAPAIGTARRRRCPQCIWHLCVHCRAC